MMVERVKDGVVRIETSASSGSGVIFETTTQGALVVTNYHVITGSSRVEVIVAGETYQSTLLGYDAYKDLAVLEICCGQFQALVIRDAEDVAKPGTEVLAIGYALGLDGEASVTRGIVSGVRYNAKHTGWVIQTDAPINPGNSGGPLLLSSGEVIGINSYIFYEDAGRVLTQGVGFALAGQTVNGALDELKSGTRIAFPTPTPTATPWPTPTPTQAVSSWKTHNNANYGYSFNVPQDWQIEVEDGGQWVYAGSPDENVAMSVYVPDYPIPSAENRLEEYVDEFGPQNYLFFEVLELSPYSNGDIGGAYLEYRSQWSTEYCTETDQEFLVTRGTGRYWWVEIGVCEDYERQYRQTLSDILTSFIFN